MHSHTCTPGTAACPYPTASHAIDHCHLKIDALPYLHPRHGGVSVPVFVAALVYRLLISPARLPVVPAVFIRFCVSAVACSQTTLFPQAVLSWTRAVRTMHATAAPASDKLFVVSVPTYLLSGCNGSCSSCCRCCCCSAPPLPTAFVFDREPRRRSPSLTLPFYRPLTCTVSQHKDSQRNNADVAFEWTEQNLDVRFRYRVDLEVFWAVRKFTPLLLVDRLSARLPYGNTASDYDGMT